MKQLLGLMFLGSLLLSGCRTTDPEEIPQTNNISIYNVSLTQSANSLSVNKSECDSLLDECAIVVEQQKTAIDEQKKLIDLQTEQVKTEQAAKEHAEAAKSKLTLLSIVEGAALLLLILL